MKYNILAIWFISLLQRKYFEAIYNILSVYVKVGNKRK